MPRFYVTVLGLPEGFYTNQWFLDSVDWCTVNGLIDQIKAIVPLTGTYELHKGGQAITEANIEESVIESGDTLTLVEV